MQFREPEHRAKILRKDIDNLIRIMGKADYSIDEDDSFIISRKREKCHTHFAYHGIDERNIANIVAYTIENAGPRISIETKLVYEEENSAPIGVDCTIAYCGPTEKTANLLADQLSRSYTKR
jgi:hypothetical protein